MHDRLKSNCIRSLFRFEFFHSGRLDLDETGLTGTVPTELGLVSNLGEYFITFLAAKVSGIFPLHCQLMV